ncbi:hypothetical protein KCU59_g102, partial [Aureobasidium melanogenum]
MSFADCDHDEGALSGISFFIFSNSSLLGACVSLVCMTILSNAFFCAGTDPIPPPSRPVTVDTVPPTKAPVSFPRTLESTALCVLCSFTEGLGFNLLIDGLRKSRFSRIGIASCHGRLSQLPCLLRCLQGHTSRDTRVLFDVMF